MNVVTGAEIKVGIAEWRVAKSPKKVVTLGLGSCVGVTLYDRLTKIGGLAHIMLPNSEQFPNTSNAAKFADLALPLMLEEMLKLGINRLGLVAKLVGGAQMFSYNSKRNDILNIGARNIASCRAVLSKLNIKIIAGNTGGNYGRTMIFDTENGDVYIRVLGNPIITI
ncbi:MAG: chemotaxis protein CheD [Bacillota bacterium]|jgi:chemotaxis protein CheD